MKKILKPVLVLSLLLSACQTKLNSHSGIKNFIERELNYEEKMQRNNNLVQALEEGKINIIYGWYNYNTKNEGYILILNKLSACFEVEESITVKNKQISATKMICKINGKWAL